MDIHVWSVRCQEWEASDDDAAAVDGEQEVVVLGLVWGPYVTEVLAWRKLLNNQYFVQILYSDYKSSKFHLTLSHDCTAKVSLGVVVISPGPRSVDAPRQVP